MMMVVFEFLVLVLLRPYEFHFMSVEEVVESSK